MNANHSHKRVHKEMRRKILPTKNVEERNTKVSLCVHYRGRVEIGGLYLPSQLERTSTTLYMMVDIMKVGGRAPPTITRLGQFLHHDGMYARKWPLPLCVYNEVHTCHLTEISLATSLSPEPVFLNVYGAQESIPRNEFRKLM
jgi:hypothetical protein